MREFVCYILLWIFITIPARAQPGGNLQGRVLDEAGIPMVGANVYLPQLERGTVSDTNGGFLLEGLPPGTYILQVSFMGHETHVQRIATGSGFVTVILSPGLITGDEVVISGGRHSTQHRNAIKIEMIPASRMEREGYVNLIDGIASLPGVDLLSRGGAVSSPVIRGLSTSNILVLVNGFRMENYQFSANHPYLVDEGGLEQVEVIKGPASLLYGSDAIGGVINLVEEKPADPGSVAGDARMKYFGNTAGIEGGLGVKGNMGPLVWGLGGACRSHMDYTDGKGERVVNSRFNSGSMKTHAGIRTARSMHRLHYEYQKWKPGMAGEEAGNLVGVNSRENEFWYQDLDNHLLMFRNRFFLDPFKLQVNLSYQHNRRMLITDEPESPAVHMRLNTFSYEARSNMVSSDKSEFCLAFQGMSQSNRNREAPNRVLPDYFMNDLALFGMYQHDFPDQVHFQVGLRMDNRFLNVPEQEKSSHSHSDNHAENDSAQTEDRMPELDRYYGNVSASIGITWELAEGLLFRGNIASAYRAPSIAELTQDGEHGLRYEQGNRDLRSQRNYELDASFHIHREIILLDLAAFYNFIHDYIYLGHTLDTTDEGMPVYRYLQGDARIYGFECVLEVLPVPWLSIKAAYNQTRGELVSTGNLPFIPQNRLRSEIRWQPVRLLKKAGLYLKIGSELALAQHHPSANEQPSDAYHLLHAGAGISASLGNRSITFDLMVNNILNTAYTDHLSVLRDQGYYNRGRNITLSLMLPFRFPKAP